MGMYRFTITEKGCNNWVTAGNLPVSNVKDVIDFLQRHYTCEEGSTVYIGTPFGREYNYTVVDGEYRPMEAAYEAAARLKVEDHFDKVTLVDSACVCRETGGGWVTVSVFVTDEDAMDIHPEDFK